MKDCKLKKKIRISLFLVEGFFFQEFWEAAISFLMKHVQNVYDSSRVQFIFCACCLLIFLEMSSFFSPHSSLGLLKGDFCNG